jgi:hypothetical protein
MSQCPDTLPPAYRIMNYIQRNYRGTADLPLIIECRRQSTTPDNISDYPTAADLYELLDPSAQAGVALWENAEQQVAAFAIAHLPYCNLSFFILPQVRDDELEAAIIEWGVERIRKFGREQGKAVALDTACRDSNMTRRALLERHGFVQQDNQTLHMERSLREPLPELQMPEGFILRQLGRAMTIAGMLQLRANGMEIAWLTTGSWNVHAQRVFESVGFRTTYKILWFSKAV